MVQNFYLLKGNLSLDLISMFDDETKRSWHTDILHILKQMFPV